MIRVPVATTEPEPPEMTREQYLKLQIDRSLLLKNHDAGERSRYLIRRMAEIVPSQVDGRVARALGVAGLPEIRAFGEVLAQLKEPEPPRGQGIRASARSE